MVCDGASEEEDVWLRRVDHVVHPAVTLLDTEIAPLSLAISFPFGTSLAISLGSITCLQGAAERGSTSNITREELGIGS